MSGGGGQNTVTQQSAPNPQFEAAYVDATNRANQVSQTPFNQPVAPVADLSGQTQQGIQAVENAQGSIDPYLNASQGLINQSQTPVLSAFTPYASGATQNYGAAGQYGANISTNMQPYENFATKGYGSAQGTAQGIAGATQPYQAGATGLYAAGAQGINPTQFSAGQVNQYESPYTKDVVNATQAQFNNQNAQQQQQVVGNAVSSGAWGGDRSAVAQALTAGQQQLAQAPVIAGLENQGYSQALQEFNQQQGVGVGAQEATAQQRLAAGQGMAGLSAQQIQQAQTTGQLQLGAAQGLSQEAQQQIAAGTAQGQLALGAGQGLANLGSTALGGQEAQNWLASQGAAAEANLGSQYQSAQYQGANALLGVGGIEQQQQQAQLNAPYEQQLAQQAYPFQTSQFYTQAVEGLGAGSGGTSKTTSPGASTGSQVAGGLLTGTGLIGLTGGFGSGGWLTSALGGLGSGIVDAAPFGFSEGGEVPEDRGIGGNVVSFPHPRPIHNTGIAGALNDNLPSVHSQPLKLRAAGGGITGYDGGGAVDGPDVNVTGDNTTSWRQDQVEGLGGGPPQITMPDMGGPAASAPTMRHAGIAAPRSMPTPPVPPGEEPAVQITKTGTPAAGGIAGDQGDGDSSMPTPPIPPPGGDPGSHHHGALSNSDIWQTVLAAGLGIMGGTSPHALTNIGRGGLQALQFGEGLRNRQENYELRQAQQQSNDLYRQGLLGNKASKLDIDQQRADIYAKNSEASSAQKMALAALETARAAHVGASHASEGDITAGAIKSLVGTPNPDNDGKPWTAADAYRYVHGIDIKAKNAQTAADRVQATTDLGNRRLDQGDQRLGIAQGGVDLRKQALEYAKTRDEANRAEHATDSDLARAASLTNGITAATGHPADFHDTLAKVMAERQNAAPPAGAAPRGAPAAPAELPDPLGIRGQ